MMWSRILSGPVAPGPGRADGQIFISQARAIVWYKAAAKHVFDLLPGFS